MSATDRYALLGQPLDHSLSPLLHRLISQRCGLACEYVLEPCPAEELDGRWPQLLSRYRGFNVTLPYKQEAFRRVSQASAEARLAEAVNTVFQTKGYNTDYLALRSLLPDCAGQTVLLLGYGGVASALANVALQGGCARLWVCGRDAEKARHFAALLQKRGARAEILSLSYEDLDAEMEKPHFSCELLLQGTSAGMWPQGAALPLPETLLHKLLRRAAPFVFESIYNPAATRLLLLARSAGLRTRGGLSMLFRQGLAARKIWRPELDFSAAERAESEICAELGRSLRKLYPQKLLLTGFMGAGKSRMLGELARLLDDRTDEGLMVLDLDRCIEAEEGQSIVKIFATKGEAYFRRGEAGQLKRLLHAPRSGTLLLATGGGSLLQPEALQTVRAADACIVFLDVSLDCALRRLRGGHARPLLQAEGDLSFARKTAELYNLRRPLYQALADLTVDADQAPEILAREILCALGWTGLV